MRGPFGPFTAHNVKSFSEAFYSKGFGQVDIVMQGNKYLNDGGAIVLTTRRTSIPLLAIGFDVL